MFEHTLMERKVLNILCLDIIGQTVVIGPFAFLAEARQRWGRAEYVRQQWLQPVPTSPLHAHGSVLGRGNCNTIEADTPRSRGVCREQQQYSCKEFDCPTTSKGIERRRNSRAPLPAYQVIALLVR